MQHCYLITVVICIICVNEYPLTLHLFFLLLLFVLYNELLKFLFYAYVPINDIDDDMFSLSGIAFLVSVFAAGFFLLSFKIQCSCCFFILYCNMWFVLSCIFPSTLYYLCLIIPHSHTYSLRKNPQITAWPHHHQPMASLTMGVFLTGCGTLQYEVAIRCPLQAERCY